MANPDRKSVQGPPLRLLIFSASLRTESLNTKLARLAARSAEKHGAKVDFASMREFDVPSYDGDVEAKSGIPAGARELKKRIESNDAFIIASPEYNGSMCGLLKNAI